MRQLFLARQYRRARGRVGRVQIHELSMRAPCSVRNPQDVVSVIARLTPFAIPEILSALPIL